MAKVKSFSIKSLFKIFAIILLSLTGVIGVTIGILALTGVFKPEYVALNSMSFDNSQYFIDNETYITIKPSPENTTEKTVMLTISDMQVVSAPTEVEVGKPFKITPIQTNGINNGGSAKLTASFNNLIFCEATVFVDVPVQTIEIKNSNQNQTDIIAGTSLNIGLNYTSENSLKPYGENYNYSNLSKAYRELNNQTFETSTYKIIEGNDVASINAATGEISTLKAGTFKVQAKIFKTYKAKAEYEQHKLAGDFNEDEWGIGKVDGKTEEEYLSERIVLATKTFTVRDVELTSIDVSPNEDIEIYLYQTLNLTYQNLGLTLTPETASGLYSDDVTNRFNDVVVTAIMGNDQSDNSEALSITDYVNQNGDKIGWSIRALKYQDIKVSKTALKFTISKNGIDQEDVISTTIPVSIIENKIVSNSFVLTSGSSDNETKYTRNLNFYAYQNSIGTQNEIITNIVKDSFDLKQTTSIQFENQEIASQYKHCVIKYYVKNFDKLDYENRVIDYIEETGEILDGIIVILREGSVEIEAKAIKIDADNNIIMVDNEPKVIATANSTLTGSTPLKLYVTEKLTNVSLNLETDEKTIYVDVDGANADSENEPEQVLRESQTIKVKIASYDFSSENTEEGLREEYESAKLIEMLNSNKLEFVIQNADAFATDDNQNTFGISYNIISDGTISTIEASLLIPLVADFNPSNTNIPQKLIRDIIINLQLTEEAKLEYGNQADSFEKGEIKIDVQTARAKSISLTTNAANGNLCSNEEGNVRFENVNYVKYIQGSWAIDKNGGTDILEVYAQFDPLKTAQTNIKIESSNEALLKINQDSESIKSDNETAESRNWEYKYLYSAQLNFQEPSETGSYSYVYLNSTKYKYIGEVTLTFTTTDSNYKIEDESGKLRDVYAEIKFHLIKAIPQEEQ